MFRFTAIPDALQRLNNLSYLSISDSTILDWNDGVMKHIGLTVGTIMIENVGLSVWPTWVRYFSNLMELNLDSGSISLVPDDALDHLANRLNGLSLSNNSLTSVPKTVSKLTSLRTLILLNNKITDVGWLPQASKLVLLALENNKISDAKQLSNALSHYSDSLTELSIDGNKLTEIPDLSFLKQVRNFDFTNNLISSPDAGSLPKYLGRLYLGYNLLTRIPVIFQSLPYVNEIMLTRNFVSEIREGDFSTWIQIVDLSRNLLKTLIDTSFPTNSSIYYLDLGNNPLSIISEQAFNTVPLLQVLILESTKLTRLPLGLSSLINVNDFHISSTVGLVCTCLEKSLARWVLSRPKQVDSECGETTIHEFFALYSQECP